MDNLSKKTLDVSRGFTYTYYTSPARASLPTIILFHGWPDTAALWSDVIKDYLLPAGYGIVALDSLGYGGTSKPGDYQSYNLQAMSKDAVEILDKEGLDKVISLGHDWGCASAQRLYNYHAERVIGLVMLNVAYIPPNPGGQFDLDATIEATTKFFGYGTYWYWKFFASDSGWQEMNKRIEAVFTVAHGSPESWLTNWCAEDGMKNYILADKRQPVESYATDEMKAEFIERMSRDGFEGPQQWYRSMVLGEQDKADREVPPQNIPIKVPTLFFGGTRDMVCRPELLGPSQEAGLLPHLTSVTVDAGHWSMLAKPKEFGDTLMAWLTKNF